MTERREDEALPEFESSEKKGGGRRRILIAGGALLFVCLCLGLFAALGGDDEGDAETAEETVEEVVQVDEAEADAGEEAEAEPTEAEEEPTEAPEPTGTAEPTNTPEPTATPQPTETPEPTATTDPNLVRPGTHLVGEDIQPGLFRGETGTGSFDSCYWERLSDLSGDFDAIIANGNGMGTFYVEVVEGDEALNTDCVLTYLEALPEPAAELPTQIGPGDYLVRIDMQAGRYRGETSGEGLDSCYWERRSNFRGGFDGILANGNGEGQFFVDVQPGDFGFHVECELELVE